MRAIQPVTLILVCILSLNACDTATEEKETVKNSNALFESIPSSASGVDFSNDIMDQGEYTPYNTVYIYNGGGVAAGDIDNDGLPDLLFTGNQVPSKLYRNLGDFKFEDVTASAGINDKPGWTTGGNLVDVNQDGLLDIYICRSGYKGSEHTENQLYINNGDGSFDEAAEKWGIASAATSIQALFFDYDGDLDQDLYLVNHPEDFDLIMDFFYYIKDPSVDTANSNRLYENKGDHFEDVTFAAGLPLEKGFSLSATAGDINGDGHIDLYVANDFLTPDYIYLGDGSGGFVESRNALVDKVPMFAMGSDIADINNDGLMDLYCVDMEPEEHFRRKNNDITFPLDFYNMQFEMFGSKQFSRNMLHIQQPDGTFSEIGEYANVARTDWSWSSFFVDLDNDGLKDLFVTNGTKKELNDRDYMLLNFNNQKLGETKHKHNANELVDGLPVSFLSNYGFKNNGEARFENMRASWGLNGEANSSGATYADLNGDGWLDLVVNNTDAAAFIYKNNGAERSDNHHLRLRLLGSKAGSPVYGARVQIWSGEQMQMAELKGSRGYQSNPEPIIHFGLGELDKIDSVLVRWPNGTHTQLGEQQADQVLELYADAAHSMDEEDPLQRPKTFVSIDPLSESFVHIEQDFIDYKFQRLIPYKMSEEGPGIAVADINDDGSDDFYVCGALGQSGKLYLSNPSGYEGKKGPWDSAIESEENKAVFIDLDADGDLDLYVACGTHEYGPADPKQADKIYINNGDGSFSDHNGSFPQNLSCNKALAAADYDGDGDVDLFVGGRMVPGLYGQSAQSSLYINEGGSWTEASSELVGGLNLAGMVTDAVWADMDGDKLLDLVVAAEWSPIQIYMNQGEGKLVKTETNISSGLWRSLAIQDLDGDGSLDIVAGNYGLNSVYRADEEHPMRVLVNDFDGNGFDEGVVYHYINGEEASLADRDMFCKQMPNFFNIFPTYRSFAEAKKEDIFSEEAIRGARQGLVTKLRSGIWFNQGDGQFEWIPLPDHCQVSPINAIMAAESVEDGQWELILAGNFEGHFYDQGGLMASRANFLIVKGRTFNSIPTKNSGLNISGVTQDLKFLNRKNDSPIILVARNNASLMFYERNTYAQ